MLYGNVVYTLKDGRKADVSCLGLLVWTFLTDDNRLNGVLEQAWSKMEGSGNCNSTRCI